jgi:hypothetical protein
MRTAFEVTNAAPKYALGERFCVCHAVCGTAKRYDPDVARPHDDGVRLRHHAAARLISNLN